MKEFWKSVSSWRGNGQVDDDALFYRVRYCEHNVLDKLLPDQNDHDHYLRPRRHNVSLSYSMDHRNYYGRPM